MTKNYYTIESHPGGSHHFIRLAPALVRRLSAEGNKRVVCELNGQITLHAALQKQKTGDVYIMIAARHLRSLKLRTGDRLRADIRVDESELQFHMPEEFAEVMATDPEARDIFEGLTPGNKRGLIALVNMVKSSDKKIGRALLIAEKLKRGIHSPQQVMKKN